MSLCSFGIETRVNLDFIAGVDEVGRGCLAGPVVCAAVVFPRNLRSEQSDLLALIQDSKKISARQRGELKTYIQEVSLACAVAQVEPAEIDEINILQATFKAARKAVSLAQEQLKQKLQFVLMDGNHAIPALDVPQEAIIKGDQFSKSIAAASIVAKVTRDELMAAEAVRFPGYGFEKHKGYGTEAHCEAIQRLGPCEIHRQSFLRKLRSKNLGNLGEDLAVEFLLKNRFRIIERNWKCKAGEIDIIAERGGELHFVEVRTRSGFADLAQIFPAAKQEKLRRLTGFFHALNPKEQNRPLHVDLIAICDGRVEPFWDVLV